MLKKYLPVVLIHFSIGAYSQGAVQMSIEKVIPPSPDAALLASFADTKVSEYTGVPNINVPIYTIKSGDLILPISLSYNSSGIRVEQEASWVGLGWVLNTGGVITRQVRGHDDFNGYVTSSPLPASTSENLVDWDNITEAQVTWYEDVAKGLFDAEPDIFYYNFNGYTGKLMFEKQTGNILNATPFDQSDIKFLYNRTIKKWEVTDGAGVKYFFGTKEFTITYSCINETYFPFNSCTSNPSSQVITAWYLDKIETPSGFCATFVYNTTYGFPSTLRTQVQRDEINYCASPNSLVGPSVTFPSYLEKGRHTASMQEIQFVYLKEIKFNEGSLEFFVGIREDIMSFNNPSIGITNKLDSICLKNLSGNKIKTFNFYTSYFNQGAGVDKLRLRLDSVMEKSLNDKIPPYEFVYNTTPLPSKNSYSMDHWGYYNGKNNDNVRNYQLYDIRNLQPSASYLINGEYGMSFRKTRIPSIEYKGYVRDIFFHGADREVDTTKIQAAMLTKIILPTKGSIEYLYESNSYYVRDSLFSYALQNINLISSNYQPGHYKAENINISEPTMVFFDYLFQKEGSGGNLSNAVCGLKTSSGNNVFQIKPSKNVFQSYIGVLLTPGQYTLYLDYQGGSTYFHQINATIRNKVYPENSLGGGLRVKSILSRDYNNDTLRIEKFDYTTSGRSSGKLLSALRYAFNDYMVSSADIGNRMNYYGDNVVGGNAIVAGSILSDIRQERGYLSLYSTSALPMGSSSSGDIVGYGLVTKSVWSKEGETNGKIVSLFKNHTDFTSEHFIPGIPNISTDDNGRLIKQEYYNASGILVYQKEKFYVNDYYSRKIIEGVKAYIPTLSPSIENVVYRHYDVMSEWSYLSKEVDKEYSTENGGFLTKTTEYLYDGNGHKNITSVITDLNDTSYLQRNFTYPRDVNNGVYADMSTRNINNAPVEETVIKDGYVVSSTLSLFKLNQDNYVVDDVFQFESKPLLVNYFVRFNGVDRDLKYQKVLKISRYNSKSNVVEFTDRKGIQNVYLWDTTGNHLMAHVLGAAYDDLDSVSDISCERSGKDLYDELKILAPNALIKTFSYKPLIGLEQLTNENGQTTYYQYDDLGRLNVVIDDNGSVLRSNRYHYRR